MAKQAENRQYRDARVSKSELARQAEVSLRTIQHWHTTRPKVIELLTIAIKAKRFVNDLNT